MLFQGSSTLTRDPLSGVPFPKKVCRTLEYIVYLHTYNTTCMHVAHAELHLPPRKTCSHATTYTVTEGAYIQYNIPVHQDVLVVSTCTTRSQVHTWHTYIHSHPEEARSCIRLHSINLLCIHARSHTDNTHVLEYVHTHIFTYFPNISRCIRNLESGTSDPESHKYADIYVHRL
jgi:hypothetical protein